MQSLRCLFVLSLMGALLTGAEAKKVYVDRMGGLEQYVVNAIKDREAPLECILEEEQPDLKVQLKRRDTPFYAEILYQKQTGRKDESVLKAIDPRTGRTIAQYRFHLEDDDVSKKRAAEAFVEILKSKLK
jgi:hypothetical protein